MIAGRSRPVLSTEFLQVKRLRSAGNFPAARALIAAHPPRSDDDAFEVLIALYTAGDFDALLKFSAGYAWQARWAIAASRAVNAIAGRQDPRVALGFAREAADAAPDNCDVIAVYLILLQMNGLIDEAADYARERLPDPRRDEALLLTVLGEIAATIGNWGAAYSLAASVIGLNQFNTRALSIASMANFELGNVHEALGNAIRAKKVKPGEQTTALQLMKCYNQLADFYSTIAAFDDIKDQGALLPEIHAELGFAYARLGNLERAIRCYRDSLARGRVTQTALRGLIKIYINSGALHELEQLVAGYREHIYGDIEALTALARERLHKRDLNGCHELLRHCLKLAVDQGVGYASLPWPVPEPLLRHHLEQLELLASRNKLAASGTQALSVLKRHVAQSGDRNARIAPGGREGELLRQALADYHYCPDPPFSGASLGKNDFSAIEDAFMAGSPRLVVIDNFLSPAALAGLREYCEEATVWKSYFDNGYVGTLFGSGFCPRVLLAIADELRMMMPRVIGGEPLTQAWAFKYDQRLTGINMHADFASVNVNFWITPEDACLDKATGGLVIYDVPAPREWTYEDYNGKSAKQAAFLAAHNARAQRVPYRENRCVLFDSTLFHTTDEIHFAPGYVNRRVNVTLLYGKSLNVD